MRPSSLLHSIAVCIAPLACTPLDGRPLAPADASADRGDATPQTDVTPQTDAARDSEPGADAPSCPRGEAVSVDTRVNLALASDIPRTPTFGATARSARLDPTGRILIAGSCYQCTTSDRTLGAVWRVDAATLRHDTTFGVDGVAVDPAPERFVDQWFAVTSDAQGRVYLAGNAMSGGFTTPVVARLLSNGQSDASFGVSGQRRLTRTLLPTLPTTAVVTAIHHDGDGTVVTLIDQNPWVGPATRALAVRVDDTGRIDTDFGDVAVREIEDTHGCFDIARDDGGYVLACISLRDRPELRRLDGGGTPVAWASGAIAEAVDAPARFAVRTLARDSARRWIVAGAVSASYDDVNAPVAAVRFLTDGTHDRTYGAGGVRVFPGPRQTFAYSFATASRVGCEDRLLFGANYNTRPVIGFLDAQGAPIEAIGDYGNLFLPLRSGSLAVAVEAIVPVPGSPDVVVVVTHSPSAITLHRVAL